MTTQHAMLVIARKVNDVITIPGEEPLIVGKDQGHTEARRWWDENHRAGAEAEFQSSSAAWDDGLEEWKRQTRVDHGRGKLFPGGPRLDIARISYPGGQQETVQSEKAAAAVSERYMSQHPQPLTAEQSFSRWNDQVKVSQERVWIGHIFADSTETAVSRIRSWAFGFPITEVLGILDELAGDGWQILHVSEDRGLYRGEDALNQASITTVRYLLRKAA